MSLEKRISAHIRSRIPRLWGDIVKRVLIILLLGMFLYGTFASPPAALVLQIFLAFAWCGGIWLLGLSPLLTDLHGIRDLRSLSVKHTLDQLSSFGETSEIIRQIESEISQPVFQKSAGINPPYFIATEHWIIDFMKLPKQFAMNANDIRMMNLIKRRSVGGQIIRMYLVLHDTFGTTFVVPFTSLKDHRAFYKYVLKRNPAVRINYPPLLQRYFERVTKD